MKKIVLSSVLVEDPNIETKLAEEIKMNLVFVPNEDNERFIKEIVDADGIVVADKPISKEMIQSMKNCKIIARQGIGYDSIDIEEAKKRGIYVCNVPDYSIEEVSEYTLALILALNRHIIEYNEHTREGIWDIQSVHDVSKYPPMRRSKNLTLGIVGMGRIARLVAKKALPFGFKLISYDPYVQQDKVDDLGVKMVTLDTLLKESDFISLNLPLTDETHHMISDEAFDQMKETAYLVNTGRGPLVDENALIKALKDKKIAGAAIDVTETEPLPKDHPLFQFKNLIVTPHAAFFTKDSFEELRERAFKEAIRVLSGEAPENVVNM